MKNFQIGMYGWFDENKYIRDFRKDFWGIEACMFSDINQAMLLAERAKQDGFRFGVHFPLIKRNSSARDPLFLSPDEDERIQAIKDFEEEAELVQKLGGDYILTHFPKPFIADRKLDWSKWRLSDGERMFEDENPYEEVEYRCYQAFGKLSGISERLGIKIILENDAYNKYFYGTNLLNDLFKEYTKLRLCLDFGRMHLMERTDNNFSAIKTISELVPYIDLIHLWNVRVDDNIKGGHYPVFPEQSPRDGWGDIGAYLKALTDRRKDVRIHFEHRSDLISDEELDRCYKWVQSYFN